MAVTVDTTTNAVNNAGQISSVSMTIGGSATFLVVLVYSQNTFATALHWNGVSMTLVTNSTGGNNHYNIQVFKLANPTTGTHNITINWNGGGGNETAVAAISLIGGVDVETSGVANNGTTGTTSLTPTLTPTYDGNILIGGAYGDTHTISEGGGQSQFLTNVNAINPHDAYDAAYIAKNHGATSMTWSISGNNLYAALAVSVRPAATGASINSFTATPANIYQGNSDTLAWNVTDGNPPAVVSINPRIGTVALTGSTNDTPNVSTTYTLTAVNAAGTATQTAGVTVIGNTLMASD